MNVCCHLWTRRYMLVKEWFTVMLLILPLRVKGGKDIRRGLPRSPPLSQLSLGFRINRPYQVEELRGRHPGVSYLCRLFSHLFLNAYSGFGINTDVDAWNRCETDSQMTPCPGCSALDTLFPWSTGSRYGFSESMRGVTCGLPQPRKSGLPYFNHLHEWF